MRCRSKSWSYLLYRNREEVEESHAGSKLLQAGAKSEEMRLK